MVSVVFFSAVSCKEKPKETTDSTEEEKSVVEEVVDTVEEVVTPSKEASLSVEERAAKLGFAKHLPAETEMLLTVHNAKQSAEQLKALQIYKLIEEGMGMGVGFEQEMLEDEMLEEEPLEAEQGPEEDFEGEMEMEMVEGPSPWLLLGQEVTIALGDTSGDQLGNLLMVNQRMGFFQAEALGRAAQAYAKEGNMDDFTEALSDSMGMGGGGAIIKKLLNDSEVGIEMFENAVMPPVYVAFRANEGELEQAAQLVNSSMAFFGMAGEMAAPVEVETAGSTFAGYKILGAKIAEQLEAERGNVEEDLGKETADALIKTIAKKNLFFVSGTVGDYVVVMMGGEESALKLVTEAKDSLVGTNELNFIDEFADKQLVTVTYGDEEMLETLIGKAGGLSTYALGIRSGISGGNNLGDTRDIQEMLLMIADREKALLAMGSSADSGMIAFVEDGLKIESFGGYDKGGVDWGKPTELAHLGDSGDSLLFLNIPTNAAYDEKMGEYLEAIFETAYAMTMKLASLDLEAPELAEMKGYTQLFNEKFREDFLGVYEAISGDFADGLGHESAFIVDLQGSMPAIPGVPQEVVDEGKAPRLTMIAPVTDRSKLKSSWEEINVRATSLLATVSEMADEKIPMQKPISSEKDGMTTWFISFPFFQDDFLPSVTLSDEWFAASTSKTQATDLMQKAAAGGAKGEGVKFHMNFNVLSNYADEMLNMVDGNADVIFKNEWELESFNREKEMMKKMIEASRDFESLTWDVRKEDGQVRSRIHFKTK